MTSAPDQTGVAQPAPVAVAFQRLEGNSQPLPSYETPDSAGMDLRAAIVEPMVIEAGARTLVPLGFAMALPRGFEAQVRPRSGMAYKHGITVANAPGTIDADYRGEVKVILMNVSADDFTVEPGMRIAQMVIAPVVQARVVEVASLDDTERGSGGFGSTGTA